MRTVKDTNGKEWQVGTVLLNKAARDAQISPGFGQINLSEIGEGGNHRGIQLPEHMIRAWLRHQIAVRVG